MLRPLNWYTLRWLNGNFLVIFLFYQFKKRKTKQKTQQIKVGLPVITRGPRIPLRQFDPIEQSKQRHRPLQTHQGPHESKLSPKHNSSQASPLPQPSLEKMAWSGSSLYYLDLVSGSQDSLIYCQENNLTLRTRPCRVLTHSYNFLLVL